MLSYFGLPVVKLFFSCCFAKVESSPVKLHHIVENSTNSLFLLSAILKRITLWSEFACKYTEWKVSNYTPGYCKFGFRYVFYISTKPVLLFYGYIWFTVSFFFFLMEFTIWKQKCLKRKPLSCGIFLEIYIRQKQLRLDRLKKNPCPNWWLVKVDRFSDFVRLSDRVCVHTFYMHHGFIFRGNLRKGRLSFKNSVPWKIGKLPRFRGQETEHHTSCVN